MPQEIPELVRALRERIKELSCLYEVSNIAATSAEPLEEKLRLAVSVLPKAWQHPEYAVAELRLDGASIFSGALAKQYESQLHPVHTGERERGFLAMHYNYLQGPPPPFLHEEALLIKTLAQAIGGIIERDEQRQREELLKRKFEQADRLSILGEITAGIAHELNTPLGNILGFAQLIQERTEDRQVKQDIEKIINSAMHSREVVKKLMFFSCEMPQRKQWVSIGHLIEEALQLLRINFKNVGVKVRFIAPETPVEAKVDPVQFTQVIFNFLINALHASTAGQDILIELEREAGEILLRIQDFGHGMPDDIRKRVFEPFFSTKAPGEGSGLGLSVAHGIIKSHGGGIQVESAPQQGASFTVRLPVNPLT